MDPLAGTAPLTFLLRAIGVEAQQPTAARKPITQRASRADPLSVALPDLAEVAAATEHGVLALEQEAS
eukprot:4797902-Amphidinium_carterae.1